MPQGAVTIHFLTWLFTAALASAPPSPHRFADDCAACVGTGIFAEYGQCYNPASLAPIKCFWGGGREGSCVGAGGVWCPAIAAPPAAPSPGSLDLTEAPTALPSTTAPATSVSLVRSALTDEPPTDVSATPAPSATSTAPCACLPQWSFAGTMYHSCDGPPRGADNDAWCAVDDRTCSRGAPRLDPISGDIIHLVTCSASPPASTADPSADTCAACIGTGIFAEYGQCYNPASLAPIKCFWGGGREGSCVGAGGVWCPGVAALLASATPEGELPATQAPRTGTPATAAPRTGTPPTPVPPTKVPRTGVPPTTAPQTSIPVATPAPPPATPVPLRATASPRVFATEMPLVIVASRPPQRQPTALPLIPNRHTRAPLPRAPLTPNPPTSTPSTYVPVTNGPASPGAPRALYLGIGVSTVCGLVCLLVLGCALVRRVGRQRQETQLPCIEDMITLGVDVDDGEEMRDTKPLPARSISPVTDLHEPMVIGRRRTLSIAMLPPDRSSRTVTPTFRPTYTPTLTPAHSLAHARSFSTSSPPPPMF